MIRKLNEDTWLVRTHQTHRGGFEGSDYDFYIRVVPTHVHGTYSVDIRYDFVEPRYGRPALTFDEACEHAIKEGWTPPSGNRLPVAFVKLSDARKVAASIANSSLLLD